MTSKKNKERNDCWSDPSKSLFWLVCPTLNTLTSAAANDSEGYTITDSNFFWQTFRETNGFSKQVGGET